ncbi:hypothetical protein HN358_02755 [Candidatus Uhrbacteria bacterium]|jgi:hypothetical protein|nr:hypothetical protein [Candidatus Uhrbacteria bacterium]MBT7717123.1 hypothetical protein [Candidatus Uhrbacteria bacterium]
MNMSQTKTKTRTKTSVKIGIAVGAMAIAAAGFFFAIPRVSYPSVALMSTSTLPSVPGEHEVMYFYVSTKKSDTRLREVTFEIDSTDNEASGWNTCGQLGAISTDPAATDLHGWSLYDMSHGGRADTEASWAFYDSANVNCADSSVVDHPVAYAVVASPLASVIPASPRGTLTGETYILFADTSGASAVTDDSFRVTIPDTTPAIIWEDDRGVARNARFISGLPVVGSTIIF